MAPPVPESAASAFLSELGRRNVYRTGVAYAVAAVLLWQVAEYALPRLGFPPSALGAVLIAAFAGFPIALVLAWFYDIVPARGARQPSVLRRQLVGLGRALPIALACIAFVACGGVAWWIVPHERMAVPDGNHLLIAAFDNQTGDSIFDGSLDSALRVGLAQSHHVSLAPRTWIEGALREMRAPADAPLVEATALEVALRSGMPAVLVPSISRVGDRFHLATRLVDPETEQTVVARSTTARDADEVLTALDDLARQLRADLGEPLASLLKRRVPLDRATTSSLEALRAWSEANRHWEAGRQREAGLLYARAVELDSTFAVAHADLGQYHYWGRSDPVRGAEHMAAALRHSEDMGERERLVIRGKAAEWRGDREAAISAYRTAVEAQPDDPVLWGNLGYQYLRLGRHDQAIAAYEHVVDLDSLHAGAWINLATLYSSKGEPERAIPLYERAFGLAAAYRTVNNINHEYGFTLLAAGRPDAAENAFRLMLGGDVSKQSHGHRSIALLRMSQGRFDDAIANLRQAVTLTRANGSPVSELRNRVYQIEAMQLSGLPAGRELQEAHALAIAEHVPTYFLSHLGTRLVRAGQLAAAREVLDSARARIDQDRESRAAAARLAGEIAAAEGDEAGALENFNAAAAYNPDDLVVQYALGLFHADRGRAREAEGHLQRLVERDRLIGAESLVPTILAHYRLGRLHEESGRPEEAVARYRRFLEYWGDAEIAEAVDARERLASLGGR